MEKAIALTPAQATRLLENGETIMVKEILCHEEDRTYFQPFNLSGIEGRDAMPEEEILHYLKSYYSKFEFWK